MKTSRIRAKLAQNEPVLCTTLHLADPAAFELTSLMGFDGIWLDLEHHAHSLETASHLMRAARVGSSDVIARPAKGEFMRMGRLLEAGAQGIMYPRCESVAEAREVVKWAKFPPLGKRGVDGGGADMPYCSMPIDKYLEEANRQTFIIAQIEEEAALDSVDEIAAVEGIDVLFLGPGDFSTLGGYPGQFDHAKLAKATQRIAAAARRSGIAWGRPVVGGTEEAERYLAMGARFLAYSADILILKRGLEQIQAEFGALGFGFQNRLCDGAPAKVPAPHSEHRTGAAGCGLHDRVPLAAAGQ